MIMSEVNTSGEKKVVVGAQDGDKVNVLRLQEPDEKIGHGLSYLGGLAADGETYKVLLITPDPKNFGTVLTLGRTLDDEDAH